MIDKREAAAEKDDFRRRLFADHEERWRAMVQAMSAGGAGDAAWLMYSANYLFRTGGFRWSLDPFHASRRVPGTIGSAPENPLPGLEAVLLTHRHGDHADTGLWQKMRGRGIAWVVPGHLESFFLGEASMKGEKCIAALPGLKIRVGGIEITPFRSPHWEQRSPGVFSGGVPATGYFVQTPDRALLFPGDVRTFDPSFLPEFPPGPVVFAHLFLGRGRALDPEPDMVEAFVDFHLSFRPSRVVVTLLRELARDPGNCWLERHAEIVRRAFRKRRPRLEVTVPGWFEKVAL